MNESIPTTIIVTPELKRQANRIARRSGCSIAHRIIFGDRDAVVSHVRFGYRKYTTGEYVPKAYIRNFGWKNTYYQCARTTVMLAI